MPIPDFNRKTFVAFVDICGFKQMMKHDNKAAVALDQFYNDGYNLLRSEPNVHGVFISDCAVLFSNRHDTRLGLQSLLKVICKLNRSMLVHDVMPTTSIAFGDFSYHRRIEFEGIEKNPIYGNAYVRAFFDNESVKPKLQPGQCRIVKQNLDQVLASEIERLREDGDHLYFYWTVRDNAQISSFVELYKDPRKQKYPRILEALKSAVNFEEVTCSPNSARN